jgi:D-threo-aldose 1-dehydrogenase
MEKGLALEGSMTIASRTENARSLETVEVGQTGLKVPKLGFGTVALGLLSDDEEEIGRKAIEEAYSRGLTFFDTAPSYGHGRAERRLGEALKSVERSTFVVSTKVGMVVPIGSETHPADWRPPFDYSYDAVMRTYETSLRRLGMDRIDIVLIHDIGSVLHKDRHPEVFRTAMDDSYRALRELKDAGAVMAIGIGDNQWQVLEQAAAVAEFDAFLLAGRYTLLEQTALDTFLPMCERHKISVFAGGPFNSGILAKGPTPGVWYNYAAAPEHILERVRRIQSVCECFDVPLSTAALRFPGAHPVVASVIFGPRSEDEVRINLEQFDTPIDPALWRALKNEQLVRADAPTP